MLVSFLSFYLRLKWFMRCLATMFLLDGRCQEEGGQEGQENESRLTDLDLPAVEEVAAVALEMALLEAVEPVAAGDRSVNLAFSIMASSRSSLSPSSALLKRSLCTVASSASTAVMAVEMEVT